MNPNQTKCAKNARFSLFRQVPYKIGIAGIHLDFCKNVFFITKNADSIKILYIIWCNW